MRALSLMVSIAAAPLAAADPASPPPAWTIQVDPLTTALGFTHLQVERVLAPRWSVYAGPHLHLFSNVFADPPEDFLGLGLEVGVRRYFRPGAPRGAWILARGVVARLSDEENGQEQVELGGYGSALVGYTWLWKERLVLSGGAGAQFIDYEINGEGVQGLLPALHTALGIAF